MPSGSDRLRVLLRGGPLDGVSTLTIPTWFHETREHLRLAGQTYQPIGEIGDRGHAIYIWLDPA